MTCSINSEFTKANIKKRIMNLILKYGDERFKAGEYIDGYAPLYDKIVRKSDDIYDEIHDEIINLINWRS